jgi:O-antigen/teichoic acid export membrane protein
VAANSKIPFVQVLMQYSNTALNILFPLILFPYMTRTLGPSGYGVIGFYESLMAVVNVLAAFGVTYYGLRLLSKSAIGAADQSNTVLHLLLINAMMSLLGMLAYLFYVLHKPVPIGGRNITFLYGYIMLIYMFHADWYFQSQEQYRFLLARTFFLRLFVLVSSFLLVRNQDHLVNYIIISATNYSLLAASTWWKARSILQRWKWDPALFRRLLIALLPFALMGVLSTVYIALDTIILARSGPLVDIGYYTVSAKIVRLGLNVFIGGSIVFFVRLFRTAVDKDLQAQSLLMMVHLSIPVGALLFSFAGPVILFVSGKHYEPAIPLLKIFSLLWLVVPMHDFFNIQVLLVHHKEKWLLGLYGGAALLSLILNLVLIKYWLTTGAAIAILVTETAVLIASIVLSRKYFSIHGGLLKEIISGLLAFPIAWGWQLIAMQISNQPFLELGAGVTGFLLTYISLQVAIFKTPFWRNNWNLLRTKLNRKTSRPV